MGTKNNPGAFDCYANAEPDEPMFILLGRDPLAAELVRLWVEHRESIGEDKTKVAEALECVKALQSWCVSKGRTPLRIDIAMTAVPIKADH